MLTLFSLKILSQGQSSIILRGQSSLPLSVQNNSNLNNITIGLLRLHIVTFPAFKFTLLHNY